MNTETAPQFRWKEVNCFTRPQALMCDAWVPEGGQLFLFLEALYRTWGVDGYFAEPDRLHFRFATDVVTAAGGPQFVLHRIDRRQAVRECLLDCLRRGPALMPANLRGTHFLDGRDEDLAHYFIITAADGETAFETYDWLPQADQEAVPVYRHARLSFALTDALVEAYWRSHVDGGRPTPHGEPGYWLLQLSSPVAPALPVPEAIVRAYRGALAQERALVQHRHFDTRHLDAMWQAFESEGRLSAAALRGYLSVANECAVHLRLLVHALRRFPGFDAEALERKIEQHLGEALALRTRALVRCLAGAAPRREDWDEAADRLWRQALDMRAAALEEIDKVCDAA